MADRGNPSSMRATGAPSVKQSSFGQKEQQRQRVRIRFRKIGDLRWIGHRDLVRAIERVFRRTGVKLVFSEGYHPKPRMTFPSALPLGIEGWNEVAEIVVAESIDPAGLLAALNSNSVEGLEFVEGYQLPPSAPKPQLKSCVYRCTLEPEIGDRVTSWLRQYELSSGWPVQHGPKSQFLDLKQHVYDIFVDEYGLCVTLRPSELGGPTIREVLTSLGLSDYEKDGGLIVRANVLLADEEKAPASGEGPG
ncbi:MAG: TIGR03936 family radical SAM-associated protein [Thermoguttaceae bacterium]|nr:TIGR03936 family radical SAM-associated protein [Thermoguttaceae bacterium]MDW8078640.1 TIGR03936 family radical SAM-associated protein [Thermoguttaceae bacterium]